MKQLFPMAQYLLPKRLLTALVGSLAESRIPWLKDCLIRLAMRVFDIGLADAVEQDPRAYASFNEFFTRALRPDARPLCPGPDALVSPVDGTVSAFGRAEAGSLFQAKGLAYPLLSLLGGDRDLAERYSSAAFITLYLSPRDYHRVHWPRTATVRSSIYVPGSFFSVNPATVGGIPNLFARNERLIIDSDEAEGPLAVVMVGAMIVAGISTSWHPDTYAHGQLRADHDFPSSPFSAGAELGRFRMGSTVILLLGNRDVRWADHLTVGASVRMGEALAELKPGPPGS